MFYSKKRGFWVQMYILPGDTSLVNNLTVLVPSPSHLPLYPHACICMTWSLPGDLPVTCGWSATPEHGAKREKDRLQLLLSVQLGVAHGVSCWVLWDIFEGAMRGDTPCWDGEDGLDWSFHRGNLWQLRLDLRNSQTLWAVLAPKTLWAEIAHHPHLLQTTQDWPLGI